MKSNILLVDDVRLFLEMQKEFLQNSQVKIVTARNGVEALHAIDGQRPDIIFMDLEMPEMNGADCCRAIKSRPASAAIPVVMITTKGDQASRTNCHDAGCDDFLTKPLDRKLFLDTANYLVEAIKRPKSPRVRGQLRAAAQGDKGRPARFPQSFGVKAQRAANGWAGMRDW